MTLRDIGETIKQFLFKATPPGQLYNTFANAPPQIQRGIQQYPSPASFIQQRIIPQVQQKIPQVNLQPIRQPVQQFRQQMVTQAIPQFNRFLQGGINRLYGQAPVQVPQVLKPFTTLPEISRGFARGMLSDIATRAVVGTPETQRLSYLTTKLRKTPQEEAEWRKLASEKGQEIAIGMITPMRFGKVNVLAKSSTAVRAYDALVHDLRGLMGNLNRKFTPQELDNAIERLSKIPAGQGQTQLVNHAAAVSRFIKGLRAGVVQNIPRMQGGLSIANVTRERKKVSQNIMQKTEAEAAIQRVKQRIEGIVETPPTIPKTPVLKISKGQSTPQLPEGNISPQIGMKTGQPSEDIVPQKKFFGWLDE